MYFLEQINLTYIYVRLQAWFCPFKAQQERHSVGCNILATDAVTHTARTDYRPRPPEVFNLKFKRIHLSSQKQGLVGC